jgi:DUF1365 family protein
MQSAIYEGRVRHRRFAPVEHAFQYSMFMMYLDLDELPTLFERHALWSNEGRALARFRRRDHLKNHAPPAAELNSVVRDLVTERSGTRPTGPIRLLTHLEYFRYRFNPVSFYFCFDQDDQRVDAVIAEINNTPWGEQHCYVLSESENLGCASKKRFEFGKAFHISPFMGMDTQYAWYLTQPAAQLGIHMENLRGGEKYFDATMTLRRREITRSALNAVLFKYPLMTLQVIAAIHWQAFRLWLKRCPYYPHPKTLARDGQGAGTC